MVPAVARHPFAEWLRVHPLATQGELCDEQPRLVRRGRRGSEQPEAFSAEAGYRLVICRCLAAGTAARLADPYVVRSYWATRLLAIGASIYEVSARPGRVDLRMTASGGIDRSHQRVGRGY